MTEAARLVLGTAQWGVAYGIANRTGMASPDEVAAIVAAAAAAGIDTIDTARAYGEAEAAVGAIVQDRWRVVTKLAPDPGAGGATADEVRARSLASLAASRAALGRDRLDAVLLHRPADRHAGGGAAWAVLREERGRGRIGAIGISVVSPSDLGSILDDDEVEIVQVPASLLDQRLHRSGMLERAALGHRLFVRSIWLQGAAHIAVAELPPHLAGLAPILTHIDAAAAEVDATRADVFLAWARTRLPADSRIVIGCETAAQLRANLTSWARDDLDQVAARIEDDVPELRDTILDPWRWPAA